MNATYNITAYATADNYPPSDKANATLYWVGGRLDNSTGINAIPTRRGIVVNTKNGTVTLSRLDNGEKVNIYSASVSNLETVVDYYGVVTREFTTGQMIIAKIGNKSIKILP